jgi:Mg/Co/Ni transporter MgtE
MAISICILLSIVGLGRCMLSTATSGQETLAITLALSIIVFTSILMGSILPLGLFYIGFDPAHASTTIQVVMDIAGVLITCLIASFVLKVTVEAPVK